MGNNIIALIGANGQLGTDLAKVVASDQSISLCPLTHEDIEISDEHNIKKTLDVIKPNIIINTAAYNKVDEIEGNPGKAFLINGLANKYLANYSRNSGSIFVYISTDYIFGIDKERKNPYIESDIPGPINAYGISKLAGEYFTRYECENHFIVRTCGLYGMAINSGKGRNFITSLLKKAQEKNHVEVVNDQIVTPTYTYELAKQIIALIRTENYGTYHASAEGACTWYEFAQEIFKLANIKADLIPISSRDLSLPAKRATYSVLENDGLKKLDINIMRHWKEELKDYIKELNI